MTHVLTIGDTGLGLTDEDLHDLRRGLYEIAAHNGNDHPRQQRWNELAGAILYLHETHRQEAANHV
jgi:hypothetical protein